VDYKADGKYIKRDDLPVDALELFRAPFYWRIPNFDDGNASAKANKTREL